MSDKWFNRLFTYCPILAGIWGIGVGINTKSAAQGAYAVFYAAIHLWAIGFVLGVVISSIRQKENKLLSDMLDALLPPIRTHAMQWWQYTTIATVVTLCLAIAYVFVIQLLPAEDAITKIKNTIGCITPAAIAMFLGWLFLFIAFANRLQLYSSLKNKINQEDIERQPQGMVETAFTKLEDALRKKLQDIPELADRDLLLLSGKQLADLAFGDGDKKSGYLSYGASSREAAGVGKLLRGAFDTFRNPSKHRVLDYGEATARQVIIFVDILLQIVEDKAEPVNDSTAPPS